MGYKKQIGIYKITNPVGKIYIGQSVDIQRRFKQYRQPNYTNKQTKLINSFKKYGIDKHIFEIVHLCSIQELNSKERSYQELYNVIDKNKGLNCILVKSDSKSGHWSKEIKEKMSKSSTGKKHSPETKEKMRKAHLNKKYPTRKGKYTPRTKEWLENQSKTNKARGIKPDPKYLIGNKFCKGKVWVYNEQGRRRISKEELKSYLEKGYKKGFKIVAS